MAEEIRIRRYQPGDEKAFLEAARESTKEVFAWLPWCRPEFSLEDAKAWTESRRELFDKGAEYEFAIVGPGERLLGGCGINQINKANRMANLGYWVRTSATGHGVATRAVGLMAAFAFSETDLERLEIVCIVENAASQRVAEKAGAIREGVLHGRLFIHDEPRDAVMYAILRSRWKAA